MSTKMDENDWAHTLAVFRACLPRRGRKAEDMYRRFPRGASFLHRGERSARWLALCRSALVPQGTAWGDASIELSKTAFSKHSSTALASMSSTAHLPARCSTPPSCARMCRRPEQKGGKKGSSAPGGRVAVFTTKIHAKSGRLRGYHRLRAPDAAAKPSRRASLRNPCSISRPDIQPRAVICDKGLPRQQGHNRGRRKSARHRSPSSPTRPTKRTSQASSHAPSTRPCARIEQERREGSSALQTRSAPMRKDRTKLQINRQLRRRPLLDQIRPHGLMMKTPKRSGDLANGETSEGEPTPPTSRDSVANALDRWDEKRAERQPYRGRCRTNSSDLLDVEPGFGMSRYRSWQAVEEGSRFAFEDRFVAVFGRANSISIVPSSSSSAVPSPSDLIAFPRIRPSGNRSRSRAVFSTSRPASKCYAEERIALALRG